MDSSDLRTRIADRAQSERVSAILRVASILIFVQYTAHGSLFLLSITGHQPSPIAAIPAGPHHSYWDLYVGYGLLAILSGVVEAILIWQIAFLARNDPARIRPVIMLFIFANLAHACLVWRYFSLIPPVAFDLLVAVLLALAFVLACPKKASAAETHSVSIV